MYKHFIGLTTILLCIFCLNCQEVFAAEAVASDGQQDIIALDMLEMVNEERRRAGLQPLLWDTELAAAAEIRCQEAVEVFGHVRPDGQLFYTVASCLKNRTCGENIAGGQLTLSKVMEAWMASPVHRENILCADYKYIGAGCYYDPAGEYEIYWVQLFAAEK